MHTAQTYQARIDDYRHLLNVTESKLRRLGLVRLACFLAIAWFGYKYFSAGFQVAWLAAAGAMIAGFVASLVQYQRAKDKQALYSALLSLNEKELKLVTGGGADFEDGEAFIDDQHDFSGDLDVFGPSSLYQHMNRTGTLTGRDRLAAWLRSPLQLADEIQEMQAAVKELSPRIGFRQDFTAHAQLANETPQDMREIRLWKSAPMEFLHRKGLLITAYVMPVVVLGGILYYAVTGVFIWMLLALFVNWGSCC